MRPEGDPPLCDCHGEPMRWHRDTRRPPGGYWRCREKRRAGQRRWQAANQDYFRRWRAENIEKIRESDRRWRAENPEKKAADNARNIRICGMYLGRIGFTDSEVKEMISGSSD